MPKFALLGGKFTDEDGKVYDAGDGANGRPKKRVVVNSDLKLDEMFRNKFERLDGPTAYGPEGEDSDADYTTADPPGAVKQKLDRQKKTPDRNSAPTRNPGQSVRQRAEDMEEETDEDGDTEQSKPVRAKVEEKAKQAVERRTKRDADEDDEEDAVETDDDNAEAEPAEDDTETEDGGESPKPARMGRGRKSRAGKRK